MKKTVMLATAAALVLSGFAVMANEQNAAATAKPAAANTATANSNTVAEANKPAPAMEATANKPTADWGSSSQNAATMRDL